ncbi:MAG: histidine ammonia-lyase [Alphaproteobacteria bacterium]|nr:histidine ammonia-lyase [Alphaproteobacteria bacterium]
MTEILTIEPRGLDFETMRRVSAGGLALDLSPEARSEIDAGYDVVRRVVGEGRRTYGVNTGFGALADRVIPEEDLEELQRRLVLSNACGTGGPLPDQIVRKILVLKIAALASGRSGVRRDLVTALIALYNADILPCVPAQGSVGASGDLAPLAHIAAVLIGAGEVRAGDRILSAAEGLEMAGISNFRFAPKEGLAMVNGTQVSTALALAGLFASEAVFAAAAVSGMLSVEAALGQDMAFDPRIQEARGQAGQRDMAAAYRALLDGSGLRDRAARDGRIQDPYSLRCQPQVMGAALDILRNTSTTLAQEINALTDNPLVFAEDDAILFGGNFHAEPVGLASDMIALALAEMGAIAERRIALLTDSNISGLPAFLVESSGLDSGFMVAQVVAAALVSENKSRAFPASVDSIPTVANFEDFVSMATHGARRLGEMADNAAGVVAIELLAACQGLEFRRPDRSSEVLERAVAAVHERVPSYDTDRFFAPDVAAIKDLVKSGYFLDLVPENLRFAI